MQGETEQVVDGDNNLQSKKKTEKIRKSKSLIWIILLIIVVAGGTYYLFLGQDKTTIISEEPNSTTEDAESVSISVDEEWVVAPDILKQNQTSTDTHKLADGTYRMYQMMPGGIYYADSSDCITFGQAVETGVREEAGKMISNPAVLQISEKNWIMIYEMAPMRKAGQQGNVPPSATTQRNLYLATSTDGKAFVKAGIAIDSSKQDNFFASVPDLVKTPDGKVRMYYVSGGNATGSAISVDNGQTWVREDGYRLANAVVDADVTWETAKNGTQTSWVMYYSVLDPARNGIYKAISTDGLKWENETKLFASSAGGAIVDPDVVQISPTNYVMFFGQSSMGGSTGGEQINLYRAELNKSIF